MNAKRTSLRIRWRYVIATGLLALLGLPVTAVAVLSALVTMLVLDPGWYAGGPASGDTLIGFVSFWLAIAMWAGVFGLWDLRLEELHEADLKAVRR